MRNLFHSFFYLATGVILLTLGVNFGIIKTSFTTVVYVAFMGITRLGFEVVLKEYKINEPIGSRLFPHLFFMCPLILHYLIKKDYSLVIVTSTIGFLFILTDEAVERKSDSNNDKENVTLSVITSIALLLIFLEGTLLFLYVTYTSLE